jgi:hypothetical protein
MEPAYQGGDLAIPQRSSSKVVLSDRIPAFAAERPDEGSE